MLHEAESGEQTKPPREYRIITNVLQREVIKRRAVDLVHEANGFDTLIFIDKSARPISYLFRNLWSADQPNKPMPKILFLNIGVEKQKVLQGHSALIWERASDWEPFAPSIDDLIPRLTSIEVFEEVYGKENISQLLQVLKPKEKGKRLIVDELEYTGRTHRFIERLLEAINGNNEYDYFNFLETEQDKEPFKRNIKDIIIPWRHGGLFVQDNNRSAFLSSPQKKNQVRRRAREIRAELKMLTQEIIEPSKET